MHFMTVIELIVFIAFLLLIAGIVLFLTHLHKRFFNYNSLVELFLHILRSYFLLAIFVIPVTYYFFPKIELRQIWLGLIVLLIFHIFSAVLFFIIHKKKVDFFESDTDTASATQNESASSINSFILDDKLKESILDKLTFRNDKDFNKQVPEFYDQFQWINNSSDIKNDQGKSGIGLYTPLDQIKDINAFFIKSNQILNQNGLLSVRITPLEYKEEKLKDDLGNLIFKLAYPFYFFWYRALPKMRIVGPVCLFLTGGRNRWISKTEIAGRMYYCGFDLLFSIMKGSDYLLIARKSHPPLLSKIPSYHGLITLERVGYKGKIIKIHKLRTMYPYSEFLQKKVFEENQISTTGKFNNDYRITNLGRFFRKYWIDEFPQLLEWSRGYIKLVGIRAMSKHFFSLYPDRYKALYKQVKPGIFSPLFDENNTGFNDIVKIEQAYLESYLKQPIITDIKYFFFIIFQILKGTRSK
jgi:lipopolysaccharide/colanic/teichoic acid biosynthesis glycosyltransferase